MIVKKIGLRGVVIFAVAALSGGLLFYTSQSVQRAEEELRIKQAELVREQEAMRVLKAEWAYLNSPPRLEALANEYLELRPPSGTEQIIPEASVLFEAPTEQAYQEISMQSSAPEAADEPVSEVFVRPPKKPVRKPIRKAPETKKRFDSLLDELGSGGGR